MVEGPIENPIDGPIDICTLGPPVPLVVVELVVVELVGVVELDDVLAVEEAATCGPQWTFAPPKMPPKLPRRRFLMASASTLVGPLAVVDSVVVVDAPVVVGG